VDLVGTVLMRSIAAGEPFRPEDLRDYGYPTPAGTVTRRIA
jgi:hypothetical protein